MKTINILKIAVISLFVLGVFTACVNDTDFDTPQVTGEDTNIANGNFDAVKNTLLQGYDYTDPATLLYTFEDNDPTIIPAYVVGDDTTGNFYKKLIVQDAPENPIAGLEIDIDQSSLHTEYNVGRKVYIKLAGLTVGYFDGAQGGAPNYINQSDPEDDVPGVYKLGIRGEDLTLDRIPSTDYKDYIVRSNVTETIVPKVITTDDFNDDNMNQYVIMENMQFLASELGKTFAGEPNDAYDAERILISCDTDVNFGLMTSTFSNFKSLGLPEEKGAVTGVLAKNYREENTVIVLNSYEDVDFTDTDRCDPAMLCDQEAVGGSTTVFEEDFEGISSEADLIGLGWVNVNVNGGSRLWDYRTYSGNSYMQQSAYNSSEDPLETWLVTPAINLDTTTEEDLSFDANAGYVNGEALTVWISTDFTGDVTTATWEKIENTTLPTGPSSGYGDFAEGAHVSLACFNGDVYVGFKYLGADSGITSTFQVDNIKVTGN